MSFKTALRSHNERKRARELRRHARFLRNMREDRMSENDRSDLLRAEGRVKEALAGGEPEAVRQATDMLRQTIARLTPQRAHPALRENLEIIVVAVAVAMGFRTYFVQPFKIPTGSMQPTLFGITSRPMQQPTITDRLPLKLVRWAATGEWYTTVKAAASGHLIDVPQLRRGTHSMIEIAGRRQKVPRDAALRFPHGAYVTKGTVLWSGRVKAGDHVFVDKVRWNFMRPRRGEIMVFSTRGIPELQQGTHYIKRLSGLPGEKIAIRPPHLYVDGTPCMEPDSIRRIASGMNGYDGYQLVHPSQDGILKTWRDRLALEQDEYAALGDNTGNSKDSRYWGAVPQENLLGPAFMVYWPFTPRWGPTPR